MEQYAEEGPPEKEANVYERVGRWIADMEEVWRKVLLYEVRIR